MDTAPTIFESLTHAPAPPGGMIAFERIQAKLDAKEDKSHAYDGGDYVLARDWRVGEARTESAPRAFEKPKAPFVHVPSITLMRGGVPQRIRGPVATTTKITAETQIGWRKWTEDLRAHGVAQAEESKVRAKADRDVIDGHRRKKAEELDAMYRRACERLHKAGKPVPSLEAWKNDRFETKYQRECQKLIAAGFQPRTREQFAAPAPNWEMFAPPELVAALTSMNHRGYNKRRRERYDSQWVRDFAGRKTARFIEELVDEHGNPTVAFRSAICISLALFNSAMPKDLIFGEDKGKVESSIGGHLSRMQILDRAYIELARNRRCHFVVDLDGWWRSVKALWKAIRKFLPPEFMPNLIVYRARESDGKGVENPHLIWLLPPGSRVIPTKGAKNLESQLKLHSMIQRGIVNQLIELGADPGHHNSNKVKNALAPGWSLACNDDSFCTMSEWKGFLPTITPDERAMTRRARQIKIERENDVDAELSNALWRDGISSRRLVIKAAQRRRDPDFLAARSSPGAFVEWLYHPGDGAVTKRMIELHGDVEVVHQVLAAQRGFVEDLGVVPSEGGEFCDRGRDTFRNQYLEKGYKPETAEEREGVETARKSEAGRVSRANEKALHCGLIAEEIRRRLSLGLSIEEIGDAKAEIVKALVASGNVSRATAYRRFDEVVAVVSEGARYQAVNSPDPVKASPSQGSQTDDSEPDCLPPSGSGASGSLSTSPSVVRRPVRPVDPPMLAGQHALRILETWRRAVESWRNACRRRRDPDVLAMPSATVGSAFWSKRQH
ncbi:hypothetical protein QIH77_02870 [Bradyrhizobium diazoefficiens]|uniref:hypothetical protein n=1 Tax=Bradyrhizobium diazoefficiens TaxID=1355477 RepID=UPI00272A7DC3|nr:hypothetical protein [Bradyrhizobium diazoefficiens]WLA74196.1 hypothetical protein QIH77_02870 [Bradyrhizobium diazoefficiens]